MKMSKWAMAVVAAGLSLAVVGQSKADTVAISGQTLDYFITGGHDGQVGNFVFHFESAVGSVAAGDITVNPSNPAPGEVGIDLSASWVGGDDTVLNYTVTSLGPKISDAYLGVIGSANTGDWTVTEEVVGSGNLFNYNFSDNFVNNPVVQELVPPAQSMSIQKDISVSSDATVSDVIQAFSVPEPSAILGGLALLGALGGSQIRRRGKMD